MSIKVWRMDYQWDVDGAQLHSQISNESSQSTTQARMGDMGKTMPTSGSPTDKPGFEKMKKNMKK